ncbi:unnamed protein product [Lampetra planeri]
MTATSEGTVEWGGRGTTGRDARGHTTLAGVAGTGSQSTAEAAAREGRRPRSRGSPEQTKEERSRRARERQEEEVATNPEKPGNSVPLCTRTLATAGGGGHVSPLGRLCGRH